MAVVRTLGVGPHLPEQNWFELGTLTEVLLLEVKTLISALCLHVFVSL